MNSTVSQNIKREQRVFSAGLIDLGVIGSVYRMQFLTAEPFTYRPGQYLKILSPTGVWLPFSIANYAENNLIELHIRENITDPNLLSLLSAIKVNNEITFEGPFGLSDYKFGSGKNVIIVVGTGFAPAKAIIEAIIYHQRWPQYLHLYWGVRHDHDFYLPLLPQYWSAQNSWLHYSPFVIQRKANAEYLQKIVNTYPDSQEVDIYFYGPAQLAKVLETLLIENGFPRENLFSDML